MADPAVAWLMAVAQQFMADNSIDSVTPDVVAAVISAAGDGMADVAAKAITQLLVA